MSKEEVIRKTRANSGRVDYTVPYVIRGGPDAKTHFEVLTTFVPRSDGTEDVCLKLSYWKMAKGAIKIGSPAEFTLTGPEVLELRDLIDRQLGLSGKAHGQYLLVKLDDVAATNIPGKNVAAIGRALLQLLKRLGSSLADVPNATAIIEGVEMAVKIKSLESAIAELQEALDTGNNVEQFYQTWCEQNAWAFGNAYAMRDEVRDVALGDSVDVLLKRTTDRFRDIFELKRPDHVVLRYDGDHRSYYWSTEATRAIGQSHRYLDALHDAAATGLRDHPEILAYYPYGTIVIGRSNDWSDDKLRALHGLNARLHSIRLITYDHLLEQAKRALAVLRENA